MDYEFISDPFDLEKINFLSWIARATPEELELARGNNSERLAGLETKYQFEIKIIKIFRGLAETRRETGDWRHPIAGRP